MTKLESMQSVLQAATTPLSMPEIMERMGSNAPSSPQAARTLMYRMQASLVGDVLVKYRGDRYRLLRQGELPL